MRNNDITPSFSDQQLEREFRRTVLRRKRRVTFVKSMFILVALFTVLVLMSNFWFPVYHITGSSMKPTLEQGMTVIASRTNHFSPKDIISVQYGDCILISRLIGMPGDSIVIDEEGIVSVNNMTLHEDYLVEPIAGPTDLRYPYPVPERHYFILGDNRGESKDSRMSVIGCVDEDALAGKIFFCIWPLQRFGFIR